MLLPFRSPHYCINQRVEELATISGILYITKRCDNVSTIHFCLFFASHVSTTGSTQREFKPIPKLPRFNRIQNDPIIQLPPTEQLSEPVPRPLLVYMSCLYSISALPIWLRGPFLTIRVMTSYSVSAAAMVVSSALVS